MVKPHIVKIKDINYLAFDDCNDIFINGYNVNLCQVFGHIFLKDCSDHI